MLNRAKNFVKRGLLKTISGNILMKALISRKLMGKGNAKKVAALLMCSLPFRSVLRFSAGSREYYHELHSLLHVSKLKDYELVRIGNVYDGGYIMVDDFQTGGIAYSFGIFNDISWDKDVALRGYDVYMYDHTIDGLPEENPRFHWSRLGLSDTGNDQENLRTLESLVAQNHHEDQRNMLLKIDVETAEWGFLETVKPETLTKFSQIVFEFHGMNGEFHGIGIPDFAERIPNILRKINRTHKLVHIHGLNNGYHISLGNKIFCNQIEVSYVLREKYDVDDDYDVLLPLDIDAPCHSEIPDVELKFWNREIPPEARFTSITIDM